MKTVCAAGKIGWRFQRNSISEISEKMVQWPETPTPQPVTRSPARVSLSQI